MTAQQHSRASATLYRDIALLGERIGSRTVVALPTAYSAVNRVARVRCDCGRLLLMRVMEFASGRSLRCRTCANRAVATKHGHYGTALYSRWNSMCQRCHNSNNDAYGRYGARGITVCDRWRHGEDGKSGFECWLSDLGQPPFAGAEMDRIDNDGNYEPGNVRWVAAPKIVRQSVGAVGRENKNNQIYMKR